MTTRDSKLLITIISEYTALSPAGDDHMMGDCPLHENGNTRTLNVTPSRGVWWCTECRQGGDVFTFARRAEGMTAEEAVDWLREREKRML